MSLMAGKYTIVSGGGSGIGFGIAQRFVEEDAASVLIIGRREQVLDHAVERLKKVAKETQVRAFVCDITDEDQVVAAIAAGCDDNGEMDAMVSNAGSGFPNPILEADVNGWKAMCDLNIIGTLLCTKHAAHKMKRKGGCIVNISSVAGERCGKWMGAYSTTKAALEMLTKCSANELAPFNIRVNAIRPGFIPTEVLQEIMPQAWMDRCVEHTPLGRAGAPEEIGDAAVYFASNMGKWTTGAILNVCGGMALPVGEDFSELCELMYGTEMMKTCNNEQ